MRDDLGGVDILVNNAGISRVGPHTHEVTDEDWHDSIAVMQSGVFFGMRAAGRIMLDQGRGGAIVNISSIRGFSPNPGRMTYCAPKAAVIMMTQIAAGEWAGKGIRVNAIAPGVMRTPMWDADVARGAIDERSTRTWCRRAASATPTRSAASPCTSARTTPPTSRAASITIDGALTSIPAG